MADDPKPRFKTEDLFPPQFEEGIASAFEAAIGRERAAALARNLVDSIKPGVHAVAYRIAAVALEGHAAALESAEFAGSTEVVAGMRQAMKTAIDKARSFAKELRDKADEIDPQSPA